MNTIVKQAKYATNKYALISVFDKTGIVHFASELQKLGYKIISTGGTARELSENKITTIPIQEITGNPESFGGRMKTISFQIESGILFDRTNSTHIKEAEQLNIKPIDIVVCNLYPFEKTVQKENVTLEDAVENIDVGGPTMIRSAAKNFKNVVVVTDPKDYPQALKLLQSRHSGESKTNPESDLSITNKSLAAKAFQHLSFYDSQIGNFLSETTFPDEVTLPGRKLFDLRYGENPHQKAAAYKTPHTNSIFERLEKRWGRDLSLTNLLDINAGAEVVRLFDEPAAAVIKHNSPCGIALGKTGEEALKRAIEADPESAFGGVIVMNTTISEKTAAVIGKFKDERRGNMDIVAAATIEPKALEHLKTLRKSMGIYTFDAIPKQKEYLQPKWIDGGFVLQTADLGIEDSFKEWKVVTQKKPSKQQLSQMKIGWKFISRIRSNAILVMDAQLPMTRGIGSGQTSRIRSTKIALEQAKDYTKNAILVSDSFFPFDDSIRLAAQYGITAIVQQGGSINDKKSIEAADELGITMITTGRRAFWH